MHPTIRVMLPLALVIAAQGRAQTAADSATAARNHFRESFAARKRGDWTAARVAMRAAAREWPSQEEYVYGAAALAARVGDTLETRTALSALADLGSTRDLSKDPSFTALRDAPALAAVVARVRANATPEPRSRVRFTLPVRDLFPEGVAYDPANHRWIVASVRYGKLVAVDGRGQLRDLTTREPAGFGLLGVRVDSVRNLIWATTVASPYTIGAQPADSGRSGLVAYDRRTGQRRFRLLIDDRREPHWLGDLIVSSTGEVYATDSQAPVVYRVRWDGARPVLEEFVRHSLFHSLQGLALDRLGRRLYLADYSHGLLVVSLGEKTVRLLSSPTPATLLGIDGMVRCGRTLIGLQNGTVPPRVIAATLDTAGSALIGLTQLDRHLPVADQPTIATLGDDRLFYVANSPWERFDDAGRLRPGAILPLPVILELPLSGIAPCEP